MEAVDVNFIRDKCKTDTVVVLADSRLRDRSKYPEPSEYAVTLNEPIRLVYGMSVLDASIPYSMYNMGRTTNRLSYVMFSSAHHPLPLVNLSYSTVSYYGFREQQQQSSLFLDKDFQVLASTSCNRLDREHAFVVDNKVVVADVDVVARCCDPSPLSAPPFEGSSSLKQHGKYAQWYVAQSMAAFLPDVPYTMGLASVDDLLNPRLNLFVKVYVPCSLHISSSYHVKVELPGYNKFGGPEYVFAAGEVGMPDDGSATYEASSPLPAHQGFVTFYAVCSIAANAHQITQDITSTGTSFAASAEVFCKAFGPNHTLIRFVDIAMAEGFYTVDLFVSKFNMLDQDADLEVRYNLDNVNTKMIFVARSSSFAFCLNAWRSTCSRALGLDNSPAQLLSSSLSSEEGGFQVCSCPGIACFKTIEYVVLRCKEIEEYVYREEVSGAAGIGIFKLVEINDVANLRFDFVSFVRRSFHPITKLSRLTFRFEYSDGSLCDFNGVNNVFILGIQRYMPKTPNELGMTGAAYVLNPNYDPDYRQYDIDRMRVRQRFELPGDDDNVVNRAKRIEPSEFIKEHNTYASGTPGLRQNKAHDEHLRLPEDADFYDHEDDYDDEDEDDEDDDDLFKVKECVREAGNLLRATSLGQHHPDDHHDFFGGH